jgi:DNA-binding NtrC family response regulator
MQASEKVRSMRKPASIMENGTDSEIALENRLEVLRVLSASIVEEVESLRRARNLGRLGNIDLAEELHHFEIDLIKCALLRAGGNQRKAARLLNIKATTLYAKIKRYNINLTGLDQVTSIDDQFRRWDN